MPISPASPEDLQRSSNPAVPPVPRRFRLRRLILMILCAWLALSTSGEDQAAFRAFRAAAERWQGNPDFRRAALDYCALGSRAVAGRPLGLPAAKLVLDARSLPFLPKRFAINEGSRAHYEAFARGPLSAYLHLCDEQSVPDFLSALEFAGRSTPPAPADLQNFIDTFHTDFPVCKDAGALESVRSLVLDTAPSKPLRIRQNVAALLVPHIRALAADLHVPVDPREMSFSQQQAVYERLDGYVRHADPELWRTKQLSDFCAGIWAQVFGPEYSYLLTPFIHLPMVGIALFVILLTRMVWVKSRDARIAAACPRPSALP